jgi:hypothetical protein
MTDSVTKPITVPRPLAMRRLSISDNKMDELCAADVFTVIAPDGRGPGKRLFLLVAEVEVYDATRSEQAVKDYRAKVAAELNPADVGGESGGA